MNLTDPIFHNEDKAREHLESIRWPHGPNCPHCGNANPDKIAKVQGKKQSHRAGLFYCNECAGQFTVTVGTVMERSKIPLAKWVLGFHVMAASKKGMSAHQLHRMLGVTYKTAWFMAHRIREAMKEDVKSSGPMGGEGKTVEADETYIGKKEGWKPNPNATKGGKTGGAAKRTVGPTWAAVTSREDIKKAFSHFEKEFPRRDAIRHTVAHEAEFRRPADLPDHVITGEMENVFVKSSGKVSLYVSGGLVGDTFTTTFEGQLLEYEVSEATLSKLKQARLHFWDALDGIDNFIREQMFGPKPSPEAT